MKCGARFRKPVSEISDRAKRYRAHSPGCRPLGPKVCFKCGSRRFVVPDHVDGDESNGKRSNLRWACKRHNTILGKAMAKAGKGVRTRQYNPTGAINLAQYVQAAVDHLRGSHDAAGQIIHATPKALRRQFAREIWFRRGYRGKNPAKRSLAKKIDALLPQPPSPHESDFFADLEERLFGKQPPMYRHHATRKPSFLAKNPEQPDSEKLSHAAVKFESPSRHPGQACASCVRFIAASPPRCESVKPPIQPGDWCKRYHKQGSAADELYRKFHGRGPDKILTMIVNGVDPYGGHPELTSLGPLVRFVVGEDVEMDDEGGIEDEGAFANEIWFVPQREYRSRIERLDVKDTLAVRQFKAWLQSAGAPDVAAVPNTRQLYLIGGNQNIDAQLPALGVDPEKDLGDLGFCYLIEYFAQKRFDRFEPMTYFHAFGEKTGVQPRLIYRKPQKMLELVGGEYVVKSVGIDN